jgi:hypothetical protein
LLAFLLDDAGKHYHPLFQIWISVALEDRSAFHMLLSNAANTLVERSGLGGLEETRYYTLSLSSVNERMNDPQQRVSEGLIGAILGLACLDVSLRQRGYANGS